MNSEFVIQNGKITEYVGNGGHIIIPYGVVELEELNFTKAIHRYEYDSNGNVIKDDVSYDFDVKNLITSIHIPSSVKSINEDTFSDLVNLNRITFDDNMQLDEIPKFAFMGCRSLKHIDIPESVKYIDSYAFVECGDITVKVGNSCRVSSNIFGVDQYESSSAKIVVPKDYKYVNEIPKELLGETKNKVKSEEAILNTSNSSSGLDLNGFQIFLLIMAVVYLILFFIAISILDEHDSMLFIVIGLGLFNGFILYCS